MPACKQETAREPGGRREVEDGTPCAEIQGIRPAPLCQIRKGAAASIRSRWTGQPRPRCGHGSGSGSLGFPRVLPWLCQSRRAHLGLTQHSSSSACDWGLLTRTHRRNKGRLLHGKATPPLIPETHLALGRANEGGVAARLHISHPRLFHRHGDRLAGAFCAGREKPMRAPLVQLEPARPPPTRDRQRKPLLAQWGSSWAAPRA